MILMSHADLVELIETVAENAAFITGVDTEHQHDEHETMHFFEEDRDSDITREFLDIGDAIDALHDGHRLARHGWVDGCYVAMGTDDEGDRYIKMVECQYEGYWRPCQIDILTVDWYVL